MAAVYSATRAAPSEPQVGAAAALICIVLADVRIASPPAHPDKRTAAINTESSSPHPPFFVSLTVRFAEEPSNDLARFHFTSLASRDAFAPA
jgi:hypothetical protein